MFHKSKVFKNSEATNRDFSIPSSIVNQPLRESYRWIVFLLRSLMQSYPATSSHRSTEFELATDSVPPMASSNVGESVCKHFSLTLTLFRLIKILLPLQLLLVITGSWSARGRLTFLPL